MKLIAVECKVVDEETGIEGVTQLPVDEFLQLLFPVGHLVADDEPEDHDDEPAERRAVLTGLNMTIARSAVEPLVQAKTRGELIEKLGELLAPFGITIAEA